MRDIYKFIIFAEIRLDNIDEAKKYLDELKEQMKSMYEYHQKVLASETERAKYNDRAIGYMESYTKEFMAQQLQEIIDFVIGCNMDNNGQKFATVIKSNKNQGLIVTSNYFVAENGVTRRSRRFSVFIGCLRDDRLGNNGNIYIVHEVEENLHFLLALAAGFVRGIDDDFLDILVHDGLCQLLHIHIFLCQGDKGIQTVVHFFPLFHPFFDNFNFEL